MSATPHYDAARDARFATVGDQQHASLINPGVFFAGVQHALDSLLKELDDLPGIHPATLEYLDKTAADLITSLRVAAINTPWTDQ